MIHARTCIIKSIPHSTSTFCLCEFRAPAFTPFGNPYPSALKFMPSIAHSALRRQTGHCRLQQAEMHPNSTTNHECTASTSHS